MLSLLILLVITVAGFLVWRFLRERAEQRLRENPPPRRIIEVSLPRGISDSRERMARFYRKIASAAHGDSDARKQGVAQVDFAYLATVPQEGSTPVLRCFIYADPDKMDAIKRAIKTDYESMPDVIEHDTDPLAELIEAYKPSGEDAEAEAELSAALPEE